MDPSAVIHIPMPSGRWLSLLDPLPCNIHFPDIAEMLAKQNRFAGGTPSVTYSVAQHSCLVSDHLPPPLRLHGLLHDGHEAPLNDWITPLKNAIRKIGGPSAMHPLERLEDRMASAIHRAAGLEWPLSKREIQAIKRADMQAFATEVRDLASPDCAAAAYWQHMPEPWPQTIKPWPWPKAAEEWLTRLHTCTRLQTSLGDQT